MVVRRTSHALDAASKNPNPMNYQKLFNYMSEEHGVVLLESDMQEICNIVNEMQSTKPELPSCPECYNNCPSKYKLIKLAFEAGEEFNNQCFCDECDYCQMAIEKAPSFQEWWARYFT
jgi:acyl carrier protein phosphodiesterase